jgi:hypothetical protein
MKGVTYNNLIRLGVLWGKGQGAYEGGTFDVNWGCHSPEHVGSMYEELKTKLDSGLPYGPFDALSLLIGDRNARVFCAEGRRNYLTRTDPST